MKYSKWSRKEMETLYKLREYGLTFEAIAIKLGNNRTSDDTNRKYRQTDWNLFIHKNKEEPIGIIPRPWTYDEKKLLYELKKDINCTYPQIGAKLNRSTDSVSNMYKRTDWKTFFKQNKKSPNKSITNQIIEETYIDNLINALSEISRHDVKRLKEITKIEFLEKTVLPVKTLPITFTELKRRAMYQLEQIGFSYPSSKVLGEGTYIIVGDCHGKHTRSGIFKLLKQVSNHISADKIIHIGHYVDDDDTGNYNWSEFDNLLILAKEEELKTLAKMKLNHEIIRNDVILGDSLSIQNQDLITDYVQSALGSGITPEFFETSTITNLHRHEFDTRCTEEGKSAYVASPGCLCEKHIVYTIKQQDFTDGRVVKQTFPTGYKKYRRMKHMYKTWQQGLIIVDVDSNGISQVNMCRIHKTSKGFATSIFDKIITETSVIDPDKKTMVITDLHVDMHDENILDIEDQIADLYKPDTLVNLGDLNENRGINHHEFQKIGCMHASDSVLHEAAASNYILTKTNKWAPHQILLMGNHERFYVDFYNKFPQLSDILDYKFIHGITGLDIEIIDLKQMKKWGNTNFVHGDLLMYGQKGGDKRDKMFRTYGRNTIMGHCHYPSCRFDCYTIGLTGKLNLEYNETNASRWIAGCGLVNSFEDVAFITNVLIIDNQVQIGKIKITPKNPSSWKIPKCEAEVQFKFYE